jgi:hypothetical protein
MAKKVVQDVVPPARSIRQIELPRDKKNTNKVESQNIPRERAVDMNDPLPLARKSPFSTDGLVHSTSHTSTTLASNPTSYETPPPVPPSIGTPARKAPPGSNSLRRLMTIAMIALLGIATAVFLVFHFFFAGAEVIIKPRQVQATIEGVFEAAKKPEDPTNVLPYEVMTIRKTISEAVPATGEEVAEVQASGMVTIHNNFSEAPQRLIKNTRFESPDGLIYRIHEATEVPGTKRVNGQSVPGEVTVEVFADKVGEQYNIAPTRFTIPGLKGDSRFEAIYAESKDPMQGGFSGIRKTVDPEEARRVQDATVAQLTEELTQQAKLEKPPGYILFNGATEVEARSLPPQPHEAGVLLTEEVTLKAAIFDVNAISTFVARALIADFDHEPVTIPNLEILTFMLATGTSIEDERVRFSLSGEPRIVWLFDENRLQQDLAGKSKSADVFNTILSTHPGIESGRAYLRPFWQQSFPSDPSRIDITAEE